jgi:ATP phosphoribosyltransferase
MRIALPSLSSRLHTVAMSRLSDVLYEHVDLPADRCLSIPSRLESGSTVIFCRGTDIPMLVASGRADIGFTGYDMAAEAVLSTGRPLDVRTLGESRPSYVCFARPKGRARIRTLYTEYPNLAARWIAATDEYRNSEVVAVHGSLEGLAFADPYGAAFVLMTTGQSLSDNHLDDVVPILGTDLCVVRRPDGNTGVPSQGRDGTDSPLVDNSAIADLPILELPAFCGGAPDTAR